MCVWNQDTCRWYEALQIQHPQVRKRLMMEAHFQICLLLAGREMFYVSEFLSEPSFQRRWIEDLNSVLMLAKKNSDKQIYSNFLQATP